MTFTDQPDALDSNDPEGLDPGWLTGLVGFHLRMAHVALHRDFALSTARFDITQKQLAAMELIARNPGASQVDIAQVLSMDRATMMGVIKRLMAKNLVERKPSLTDRRRHEIRLTDQGRKVLAEVHEVIEKHEKEFCAVLSEDECASLIDMLTRLYRRGRQSAAP
ncbi:MarR family winged helix-turn-helix transcriptional regulator [Rhizobium helianthi]|uniref:MarR family winged helix-turn-helix transcriptional regulator n=1 Tax=Rhizobium helianthi TaxID=1132695 RepID=A0ABW4M1N7_9HYPH